MKPTTHFILILLAIAIGASGCSKEPEKKVVFKVEKEIPTAHADEAKEVAAPAAVPTGFKQFRVYSDANSPDNHYAPSGWMGDYGDLQLSADHFENPHSGTTCIKIVYSGQATQGANWSGVYWQHPPNNWGARKGGHDLTGAKRLVFWVRGEQGGERIEEFRVGGIPGEYADSDVVSIGPVKLTTEWKRYEIDLEGRDMSSIIGGFMWSANIDGNPDGFVMYLDDIYYE